MSTPCVRTSQRPSTDEENVGTTISQQPLLSQQSQTHIFYDQSPVSGALSSDDRKQSSSSRVVEKYDPLSYESRSDHQSNKHRPNVDGSSDSASKTKMSATSSDSDQDEQKEETYDNQTVIDNNRSTKPNTKRSQELIRLDASSSSNGRHGKYPGYGSSSENNKTTDETHGVSKKSQAHREDSPIGFQTHTSSLNIFSHPSTAGSTLKRQSPLPSTRSECDKQQSDESLVGCSSTLPSDDNIHGPYNSDQSSGIPTNSKNSIASSNPTVRKPERSIVLSIISPTFSHNDCSKKSGTDLSESHSHSRTPPTSDAYEQKYQGGGEMTENNATTTETSHTDDQYRKINERSNLQIKSSQSASKDTMHASTSHDEHHRSTPPTSPPATPYRAPEKTPSLHSMSSQLSASEKQNDSHQPSNSSDPSRVKQEENKTQKTITESHTSKQSPSYPTSPPIDDDLQRSESSSSNQDYYQSKETVTRQKKSVNHEDQTHEKAEASNSSSSSLPKPSDRDDAIIAYIPDLPSDDVTDKELESMIRQCLGLKYQLQVIAVKCSLQLDVGIVFLKSKEDKDHLVNTIGRIIIDSSSNRIVSFAAELELVSYVVIESKDPKALPLANDISQRWTQLYNGHCPLKCQRLCSEFPNIFRIVPNASDVIMKTMPITEFAIENQTATVYFRADCCFFDDLPRTFSMDHLKSAISKHISGTNMSIYIQYNEVEANVVALTCDKTRRWASVKSINLDGQIIMKKDRLTYRLLVRSVPRKISVSRIENCEIFTGTVSKAIPSGENIILELSSKNVYKKCLEQRVLRIDDHIMDITTYSLPSNHEDCEIDAKNWYETEMRLYKSDIMLFIVQPEHPIFRWKWNPNAFLEQFHRLTSKDTNGDANQRDRQETISNQQRHLLRMTVMLNTIGVVKRGSYCVGDKEIKLKTDRLNTIVYNHQSTLQRSKTMPLSSAIDCPFTSTSVRVVNEDCLIVYEQLVSRGYRPLLLNMANAGSPGGGYRRGDGAQEENLFRRSDYFRSLDVDLDNGKPTARVYCKSNCELDRLTERQSMYPMDEFGAIYTSGLTVFRQTENAGYAFMDKPMFDVCAIAIAAYRNPKLNNENLLSSRYSIGMRKKIENIFAIAHHHNHDCLVLSAFGCGAFRNPPKHVAAIFKSVIEQYAGFFRRIIFAIIDDHNTGHELNPHGNYRPFQEVLDGLKIAPMKHQMLDIMIGPWRILNERSNKEITLSDVRICDLLPCHYGGRCRELDNKQHCREYLHPPLCPLTDSSKDCELKNDDDHMLWFRHRIKCSNGAKSELVNKPMHLNQFEQPKISRGGSRSEDVKREYLRSYSNPSVEDDDGAGIRYDVQNKKRRTEESHPLPPLCPFTPFHCRQHTLLSESTNIQALSPDVRKHCLEFLHICRFGRQCRETSSLHLEKTIHIARNMCPYADKCFKIYQEDHLNSFSHTGISDIRRLCVSAGYDCRDQRKPEHIVRYRHHGNYDHSGVIRYFGLNQQINFLKNQQAIITTINDYAENLKSKTPLSIPLQIQKFIKALSPVYQCSKVIFESILVHGHVMSRERIEQLKRPNFLIQTIQQNKHIQSIVAQYKNQGVEDHIKDYIKAIVSAECSKRVLRTQPTVSEARASYSQPSAMTIPDEDYNNTIRKEETILKSMLGPKETDAIRRCTMGITEASLNLQTNSVSIDKTSDKHVFSVLAPHLRHDYGDIVLVFKSEVMLHPDANFSIQSEASFLNGSTFIHRPWIKDSGTPDGRIKQFHQSKLHCSVLGYEHAAAAELLAVTGMHKKTMDVDLKTIVQRLKSVDSEQLFEGHLPNLIPLNYIEEVYIPRNLFASLTSAAQVSAKDLFRDSLHITHHEINLNRTIRRESQVSDKNRTEYQEYVIDKLIQKLVDNIDRPRQLRGSFITLPSSQFRERVALPFTLTQIYDQYRRNSKRDSISDEVYIYWQSMYGDMMITLSNESLESVVNQQHTRCLVCYIAETPSTTTSDYNESYSYLNYGDPSQHAAIMDKRSFLAGSDRLHRGCNVDDLLTYCLKLEKNTGQVTLSHAGPNSIYNYEMISYKFTKAKFDLNDLNYIYVSAGSRQIPIRNLIVCFSQVPDLHPPFEKNFKQSSASSREQRLHSSDRPQSAAAVRSTHEKTPSAFSKVTLSDDDSMKSSHGKNVDRITTTAKAEKPQTSSKASSSLSSESHSEQQQKTLYHESHDKQTPCRYGSACHDQNIPRHCSQYSHLPEQRRKPSADQDSLRTPCPFASSCYNTDANHRSTYSHPDEQRHRPGGIDNRPRIPCRFGMKCHDNDQAHRSKYSHPSK